MMTRRHFIAGLPLPLLPLDAFTSNFSGFAILPEDHVLSQESAAAYATLLTWFSPPRRSVLLLPGAKRLSLSRALALRRALEAGSSVLIECGLAFSPLSEIAEQRHVLRRAFDLRLGSPVPAGLCRPYVSFGSGRLVRPFGVTFPVSSNGGDSVAHFGEISVALKTRVGHGILVFLGAMLGPHVQASDPDARFAAQHILNGLIS
jgi:hypothetical protein